MIEPNSECRIFATTNGDRLFRLRDLNGVDVMDLVIARKAIMRARDRPIFRADYKWSPRQCTHSTIRLFREPVTWSAVALQRAIWGGEL
jgi:hypothetical protein